MNKLKINNKIFFSVTFLNYVGYYAVLLLLFNFGLAGVTRIITVPLRFLLVGFLLVLFSINYKTIRKHKTLALFVFFSCIYVFKLGVQYNFGYGYYVPVEDVFLYYVSFGCFPFIIVSCFNINSDNIKNILKGFIVSGIAFSLLTIFFYGRFLGKVERLSSGTAQEDIISPLALSYSSILIIGIFISVLLFQKVKFRKRILMIGTVVLAIIPFFLGASRGSLIALFLPFVILVFSRGKISQIFLSIALLIVSVFLLSYLDESAGSGLIGRFLSIGDDIETGKSSAVRLDIWKMSLSQFSDNPFFGGQLAVKGWGGHPHNIILESLQFTGIFGFIPFIILMFKGIQISWKIFKHHSEYIWVAIVFLQSLIQNLFSGAIHTASWYWLSLALLIAISLGMKTKKAINIS